MLPVQPEILIDRIRAGRILVGHARQFHPVVCIVIAVLVQDLILPRLRKLVLVVQDIVEEGIHVENPDDGVSVLFYKRGCHVCQAPVVVIDFGFLSSAHISVIRAAAHGRDVVENEVAGAFVVEL